MCIGITFSLSRTTTGRNGTRLFIPRTNDLLHNCVEAVALRALHSKKVPIESGALCFTVITHYVHHALQVGRHGLLCNITSTSFPCCRHALLRHDSLFANGTAIIKARQLAEAVSMNGVSTRKVLRTLTRGKHILATDGTVVLVLSLEAIVRLKDMHTDTHAALAAMTEVLCATDATKATFCTMKRLFALCHP